MCDVIIATGEVEHQAIDIDLPGYPPFEFWRLYSAFCTSKGAMGVQWKHSWERYCTVDRQSVTIFDGVEPKHVYSFESTNPSIFMDGDSLVITFADGIRFDYRQGVMEPQVWRLIRQTDTHQLWSEFWYGGDLLSRVLDAYGREIIFEYSGGLLAEVSVRTGSATQKASYAYDRKGRLTQAVDASGNHETFAYDGKALVCHTEKRGARRYFAYDRSGRCVLNWYEGNKRVRRLRWNANSDRAILTDSFGFSDVYRLEEGKPTAATDPLNRRVEWIYDLQGNLLCRTMPNGRLYTLSYWDEAFHTLSSVDLRDAKTDYVFEMDRLAKITNVLGESVAFGRNEAGDISSLTGPNGLRWCFDYDERGSLTRVVDPTEYWIAREESRQRIRIYDYLGEIGVYDYDDVGNLVGIREADAGKITCEYAGQDRPVMLKTADGGVVRWNYDQHGRVAEVVDPFGRRMRFQYSLFGSTSEIIYADGSRTQHLFDDEERLVAIVNGKSEATNLEYDDVNLLTTVRFFDGRVDHYRYDELNRVVEIANASGPKMTLDYDADANPVAIEFREGVRHENEYDGLGRLTRMKSSLVDQSVEQQAIHTFKYDRNGRVVGESDGRVAITYQLDPRGKLMAIEDPETFSTEFTRDGRGRAVAVRNPSGSFGFEYGAGNQLLRMVLPNGAEQRFEYDDMLRQTRRLLIAPDKSMRCWRDYRYDVAGRLKRMNDWRIGTREYEYDARGRLVEVRNGHGSLLEAYVYDSEGNIIRGPNFTEAVIGHGNRVMAAGSQRYAYDEDGRLVSIESGEAQFRFRYGPFNSLRTVVSEDEKFSEYSYDLLGRRTEKRTSLDHCRFRYHRNCLAQLTSTAWGSWNFTYAPDTLVPIAQQAGSDGVFFYTFDQIGTPTEIWDEKCNLVAVISATAYGSNRRVEFVGSTTNVPAPFHFLGQVVDEETGLHYNRFRYYWPLHGRYTVHDPIGLTLGLNLYSYVRNPLTWVDPFGLTALMLNCGYADGTAFDPCEQYAAQAKLNNINAAAANRRKKTCTSCREDKQKRYFKKVCGGNPAAGNQVDHSLELQLGGADNCCDNLIAIPGGVNQSFGSQIKNLIAGFSDGAMIPQFAFNPPGCNQSNRCTNTAQAVQRGTKSDGKDCTQEPPLNC